MRFLTLALIFSISCSSGLVVKKDLTGDYLEDSPGGYKNDDDSKKARVVFSDKVLKSMGVVNGRDGMGVQPDGTYVLYGFGTCGQKNPECKDFNLTDSVLIIKRAIAILIIRDEVKVFKGCDGVKLRDLQARVQVEPVDIRVHYPYIFVRAKVWCN